MRVVTFARVSSERQKTDGHSLVSQSQKFGRWCDYGGHEVVRAYEERMSATTMVRRRLFTQMLDELPLTAPQMIVVDSADRFSRNLEDVFDVLKRLRVAGINIWPLEWGRDDPPDIITYDSPDYLRFREEIIAAQAEAKRIKTRMLRSYAARRERGATTTSRPPFGVLRDGDALVPGADAHLIAQLDQKLLAGEPIDAVTAWARAMAPNAWKTRQGLWHALISSPAYVEAGIRTPHTQALLLALRDRRRARFGTRRTFEHEFAGVFACGRCVAQGAPEHQALMPALNAIRSREGGRHVPSVYCKHKALDAAHRPPTLTFVVARLQGAWNGFLEALTVDDAAREQWAAGALRGEEQQRRRELERAVAQIDQEEAGFASRRARAFDLLSDKDPVLVGQARKALVEIDRDERELARRRGAVRTDLAGLVTPPRNAAVLRGMLQHYGAQSLRWSLGERNVRHRALCEEIGSHPQVERDGRNGWAPVRVTWPGFSEREFVDVGLVNRAAPRRMHSLV